MPSSKIIPVFCPVLAFLFGILPANARSQTYGTANHTVTVSVQPITVIQITGGIVNLTVTGSSAIAGQDQMIVTDQSSTLIWGTNSSLRKVTVNTNLSPQIFTLEVVAVNPTVGTATPTITVTTTPNDFLLNIGRSKGTCGILYTGIALASQGTGTDAHTITFTILAQ